MSRLRFHEHTGKIAMKVGDADTIYLTPRVAAAISRELAHADYQVKNGFHYETSTVEIEQ